MSDHTEPAEGYEVFCDSSFYDMWAAREIGQKSFYETAHFMTRAEAVMWTHNPVNHERNIALL